MNRIMKHPVLGDIEPAATVCIYMDGVPIEARQGEMIAAALLANGYSTFRYTAKNHKPRGIYCAIGRCTDCIMTVDGVPNVRTCITPVRDGMRISTQSGTGSWQRSDDNA